MRLADWFSTFSGNIQVQKGATISTLAFILWLLICVCFPVVSSAQHSTTAREHAAPMGPYMGPYIPAQQISEYVREVFQDQDGDLWFGTNGDVVFRYDGKSLTYLSVE